MIVRLSESPVAKAAAALVVQQRRVAMQLGPAAPMAVAALTQLMQAASGVRIRSAGLQAAQQAGAVHRCQRPKARPSAKLHRPWPSLPRLKRLLLPRHC